MATIAQLAVELSANTAAFTRSMDAVRSKVGSVEKSITAMGSMARNAVAGFISFQAANRVLDLTVGTIVEAEKASAKLDATLRATGNAAGRTKDDIMALADEMERQTLFDDKEILNASAVLLTFKKVVGETFDRTMQAAADLSAQFGGELQSSVTMLGKALEDPVRGLTSLRKVGVSFTESEERLIKSLVDTNRTLDAQRIILSTVEGQVGGVAAAIGERGLTGMLNRFSDAWENAFEAQLKFGTDGTMPAWLQKTADLLERIRHNGMPGLLGLYLAEPDIPTMPPAVVTPGRSLPAITTTAKAPVAVAEDEARTNAIRRMTETLKAARIEMLDGADAAEIYRLQLAEMPPHVIALARANQELRKRQEESRLIMEEHTASVDAMMAAEQERGKAITDGVSRAVDEVVGRSKEMQEGLDGIWLSFQQGFEGVLDRNLKNFRDFAESILEIWAQTAARMAAVGMANKVMSAFIEPLIGGLFGGGPRGTTVDIPVPRGGGAGGTVALAGAPVTVTVQMSANTLDPQSAGQMLKSMSGEIGGILADSIRRNPSLAAAFGGNR